MLVVIANDLPPAVRGRMKLWFIEPKPNVFVSGVKDALAKKVVAFLYRHCPRTCGLLVFCQQAAAPGYKLYQIGKTDRDLISISGLQLVSENPSKEEST